jgi:hypothetical protein
MTIDDQTMDICGICGTERVEKECIQRIHYDFLVWKRSIRPPSNPVFFGGGTGISWVNLSCKTCGLVSFDRVHFKTRSKVFFSRNRIAIDSFCHTPVVHTGSGPCLGTAVVSSLCREDSLRRACIQSSSCIRLAMTTSVKIRSPTTRSSWSCMGCGSERKYPRIDEMQE